MQSSQPPPVPRTSLLAILLAAMMVLVLQIGITRTLSATVSHHAAFAVIAIVMLGIAASGAAVFVHRNRREDPATLRAATNAFLAATALCSVASFGYVGLSHVIEGMAARNAMLCLAVPAFFAVVYAAGYGIAFILAEYPESAGRVYWFDLTGASLGCLLVIPLLDAMSPLVVMLWCGVLTALAALCLSFDTADGRTRLAGAFAGGSVLIALFATAMPELTRLGVAKSFDQSTVLWEEWNRFSRVSVQADVPGYEQAIVLAKEKYGEENGQAMVDRWRIGWSMSKAFDGPTPDIEWLLLDSDAGTQIIEGGVGSVGTPTLDYLGYDITAFVHRLRPGASFGNAFIIGGGGGRDILTALHFGTDHVEVAELNPSVVRAVDDVLGEYSGQVYSHPRVHLQIGEARSVLASRDKKYDLIQMSMIDTWASSVAGAMVLAENGLYTTEAFQIYFDHLAVDGIMTLSRWSDQDAWGESARAIALVGATLRSRGIERPEDHVILVQNGGIAFAGVATLLMKRTPFTPAELDQARATAEELQYELIWPSNGSPSLDMLGVLNEDAAVGAAMHLDLSAPTDDRPFFFHERPLVQSFFWQVFGGVQGVMSPALKRIGALFLLFIVLAQLLAITPLNRLNEQLPEAERTRLRDHLAPLAYFAGIGVGFMLVEVSIIQRYLTFLGHPTYAMSVVLFGLLLSSSIGAALSDRLKPEAVRLTLVALLVGAAITAFAVPPILQAAQGWAHTARIALAFVLVVPMGMLMGTAYPLGVRTLVRDGVDHLVPWVWSINGIAGSIGALVSMLIAISQGYTAVMLVGMLAYAGTLLASSKSWRTA